MSSDDVFNFAVMEHLGPAALAGGKMSVYQAFELGWQAASTQPAEAVPPDPSALIEQLQNAATEAIKATAAVWGHRAGSKRREVEAHGALTAAINAVATALATPPQPAEAVPEPILQALRFYAGGEHFHVGEEPGFDTVSGEPANWLCSERDDDETMIEDGTIARRALLGLPLAWVDGDETPQPIEGEAYAAAARSAQPEPTPDHIADASKLVRPGWQWVPVEPTDAMALAAVKASLSSRSINGIDIYTAMLAAATQDQTPKD